MGKLIRIRKGLDRGIIHLYDAYWETYDVFARRVSDGTMSVEQASRLFNCAWRCISGEY